MHNLKVDLYNTYLEYLYKVAPDKNIKVQQGSEYSFASYLFRPNKDLSTRITRVGYVLST